MEKLGYVQRKIIFVDYKTFFTRPLTATLLAKYQQKSELLDEKIDGSITNEMYDKKVVEYKSEQNDILGQMQAHSDANQDFYLTANMVFNLAQRATEIFESSEATKKRQLLSFLLQNCTLSGSKLTFELKEPFNLIVETRHQPIGLAQTYSIRTQIVHHTIPIYHPDQEKSPAGT